MNEEKRNELAKSVVRLSRNTLLVGLRFLDHAINELRIRQSEEGTIRTEGKYFTYNPQYILEQYVTERELPVRDYLHTLLHCIFRHMYGTSNLQPRIWNLACDIAVEYTITELNQPSTRCKRQSDQENTLKLLKMQIGLMTAEKIYRYYLDQNLPPFKLTRLEALFSADDHRNWYTYKPKKMLEANEEGNETEPSAEDTPDSSDSKAEESETPEDFSPPEDFVVPLPEEGDGSASFPESFYYQEDQEAIWKVISGRMQVDLDTFSSAYGDCVGNLTQNLRSINREKYDYSSFLRKFATREEMMRLNDDEFDYIYYTYGLKHYKNMPLIEPLEYKEIKKIREFVIAIDTSGSVKGEQVQAFIQKTYNILKSTESFSSKINLHIIQCDADIQEHVKITSQEEFDDYIARMTIKGLRGTDFRPVFQMVDELIESHEFLNLKGLIYFTDGYGAFPEKMPSYETAFVFVEDNYGNPAVPSWAMKLILQKDEL